MIGKWHLGGAGYGPREQGFDVYHAGQATTKRIYVDFDSTRFDPLRADAATWNDAAVRRERMNAAIRRPKP